MHNSWRLRGWATVTEDHLHLQIVDMSYTYGEVVFTITIAA